MSSGAQAQIAASQAATEAQAQAAANALAFAREQFGEAKTNRAPYMRAGAGAAEQLSWLLGITQPPMKGGAGGGGGGGTLKNLAGGVIPGIGSVSGVGSGSGTGSVAGAGTGSAAATGSGKPLGSGEPYNPAFQKPTVDPNGAGYEGQFPYYDWTPPMAGGGANSLLNVSSGGTAGSPTMSIVRVVSPTGEPIDVPASLAGSYRSRGYTVGG